MPLVRPTSPHLGFTLAELLIALAILGVIAAFTIPKVLQAQQNERYNAIAKEAASSISSAYQQFKLNRVVDGNTKISDLTPYLNYTRIDTSGALIDARYSDPESACDTGYPCYRLHNGAAIQFALSPLGGTNVTNAIWFTLDPDGSYSTTTNGPGKAIRFWIYYNGLIRDEGNLLINTTDGSGQHFSVPEKIPPWFHWN